MKNVLGVESQRMPLVVRYAQKDIFAYLKSVYGDRFQKYREDWEKTTNGEFIPEFPLCLNYELIDACNINCLHCVRSISKGTKIKLGFDLFKKTIEEGSKYGLPAIKLGFGEPFLVREIFEMIEFAHKQGVMDIIVTTNGTLINEANIEKIIQSHITFLRISLDASSKDTYAKIRGGSLPEIEKALDLLMNKRAERKSKVPIVRLSFVVMPENEHEVESFRNKWIDKVDFIDFQNLIDIKFFNDEKMEPVETNVLCSYPWQMVAVMSNGDVRACCSWFGKNLAIGNIKVNTIKESWDSLKMNGLRKQIASFIYKDECAKCFRSRGIGVK